MSVKLKCSGFIFIYQLETSSESSPIEKCVVKKEELNGTKLRMKLTKDVFIRENQKNLYFLILRHISRTLRNWKYYLGAKEIEDYNMDKYR